MARVIFVNDRPRDWCTAKFSSLNAAEIIFTHRRWFFFFALDLAAVDGRESKKSKKPIKFTRGSFRVFQVANGAVGKGFGSSSVHRFSLLSYLSFSVFTLRSDSSSIDALLFYTVRPRCNASENCNLRITISQLLVTTCFHFSRGRGSRRCSDFRLGPLPQQSWKAGENS